LDFVWNVDVPFHSSQLLVRVDDDSITVCAGMSIQAVQQCLVSLHRSSFGSLPSVLTMTIGGSISTGVHGSNALEGPMSSSIKGMTLVLADGSVLKCSLLENSDVFCAALCSLGALGVVVEVSLWTQRSTLFAAVKERVLYETGQDRRKILSLPPVHPVSKMYCVGDGTVLVVGERVLLSCPPESSQRQRSWALLFFKRVEGWLFSWAFLLLRRSLALKLLALWYRWVYVQTRGKVLDQPSSPILEIPQFTCEYAIRSSFAQGALEQLQELARVNSSWPLHFLEVRFVARDGESLISPTAGEDELFVYIGVVTYTPFGVIPTNMKKLFGEFERICVAAGGRPHWAKEHGLKALDFAAIYKENWVRFLNVRKRLDPTGRFLNAHLNRILFGG
jgi:L-gulonolactone oxidase